MMKMYSNIKISIVCSVLVCLLIGSVRTAYPGYRNRIREECDQDEYVKGEDGSCCPKPLSKDQTKYDCFFNDPTCWVHCDEGYAFPDTHDTTKIIECREGQWMSWTGDSLYSGIPCEKSRATSPPPIRPQPEYGVCKGRPIPPEDTIGMVKMHTKQGLCENTEPLKGMVSCAGTCHSTATYVPTRGGVQQTSSYCTCCQAKPEEHKAVMVSLKCEKQSRLMERSIQIPTGCQCGPCTANQVITTTEEPVGTRVPGCNENIC